MEKIPKFDRIVSDVELVISVSKSLDRSIREHFLSRQFHAEIPLGKVLESSCLSPSVKHLIQKRIVETRNEIVHNHEKKRFTDQERSLFLNCSNTIFAYMKERSQFNEKLNKSSMKSPNRTAKMLEKESDELDFSLVAKLANPNLQSVSTTEEKSKKTVAFDFGSIETPGYGNRSAKMLEKESDELDVSSVTKLDNPNLQSVSTTEEKSKKTVAFDFGSIEIPGYGNRTAKMLEWKSDELNVSSVAKLADPKLQSVPTTDEKSKNNIAYDKFVANIDTLTLKSLFMKYLLINVVVQVWLVVLALVLELNHHGSKESIFFQSFLIYLLTSTLLGCYLGEQFPTEVCKELYHRVVTYRKTSNQSET